MSSRSKSHSRTRLFPIPQGFKSALLLNIIALLLCCTTAAQKQWQNVGNIGMSGGLTSDGWLAIDSDDTLYYAYQDNTVGDKLTVRKFDGGNWLVLGSQGFSTGQASHVSLAVDNNDTVYAAYSDAANNYKATVKKFDGIDWVLVGNAGFSAGYRADYVTLDFDRNNVPYVGYTDGGNGGRSTVMKFNGTSWQNVGNPGFSDQGAARTSLAIDSNNVPFVAFIDWFRTNRVTVMKYNGTSWVTVGNPGFTSSLVEHLSFTIDRNNTPYVAYDDRPNTSRATVMKYDGSSWITVGNRGFSADYVFNIKMHVDKANVPHVVGFFSNHITGYNASVMRYDTSWSEIGKLSLLKQAQFSTLVFDSRNIPYITYKDPGLSPNQSVVLKYDCTYPLVKRNLCAVSTDSTNNHNVLLWDTGNIRHVDSYKIFREDANSYKLIGTIGGSRSSFTDSSANPSVNSYKYKLVILDSCQRQSDLDSLVAHHTMRLGFNYLLNNIASITWNIYQGLPNLTYTVKRSNNNGPFVTIDSFAINGSDTTYLDINPPPGSNMYRVDIPLTDPCTAGGIIHNEATSNTVTSWTTEIEEYSEGLNVLLTPNPAHHELTIRANDYLTKIDVFNFIGQKLLSETCSNKKQCRINVSGIPPGIYIVRVNDFYNATLVIQ